MRKLLSIPAVYIDVMLVVFYSIGFTLDAVAGRWYWAGTFALFTLYFAWQILRQSHNEPGLEVEFARCSEERG